MREVATEIAGSVWKIECQVGDRVEVDQVLMILESMKMEIPIEATAVGMVAEVLVSEGDQVSEDDPVALLETA